LFGGKFNPATAVLTELSFPRGLNKGEDEALKKAKELDRNLAKRDEARKKAQRKGERAKPTSKRPPFTGIPYVQYRLTIAFELSTTGPLVGENLVTAPFSITKESGTDGAQNYYLKDINGKVGILSATDEQIKNPPTITNAQRVDGQPNPEPSGDFEPVIPGEPLTGLDGSPVNQNEPVLPGTASGPLSPTSNGQLPDTGAPKPTDGDRNPGNPADPTTPTPLAPTNTNPGQGVNTPTNPLPPIPAAPSTGSATATQPLFPSEFTRNPEQRNDDTYREREPEPQEPQRKQGCADPCIATLQNAIPPLNDSLDGLQDLLDQLLAGQQQQMEQQEEEQQQNELITINVPVCTCNDDGTATTTNIAIQVQPSQQSAITNQFTTLAAIQSAQCKIQRHTERAHNILGGDIWFQAPGSRDPLYKVKLERKLREVGTVFGFPAIPDEDPTAVTIEEEQARLTGQPIPGQVKIKNLVSLINLYTSNIYHRAGYHGLPASVPKTLLGYTDNDDPIAMQDFASYFVWFVKQVDGLIGKFPINITIEDVDPLTQGNQTKNVELPNISEALAEMYGLNISSSVNGDVAVNFLMRLASEVIATKNSSLITQDYVRANAAFLGYKGNPARREVNYSFDAAKLGSLDEFLNESKGYVVGWEEDDKESVVGFLQRIVFSAGIIKAAFFRDQKRLAELQKEIESMMTGNKAASDAEWDALLALINDPANYFNKDSIPHPRVRNRPTDPPQEPTP
jgi:hypothetical protein